MELLRETSCSSRLGLIVFRYMIMRVIPTTVAVIRKRSRTITPMVEYMMMLSPPVGSVAEASLVNVKALLVVGVSDGGVGGVGVGVGKELEAAGVTGVGVTSWMEEDRHWKVTIYMCDKNTPIDECAYLHAAVSVCRNVACNFFACLHAAACSNAPYIFLLLLAYLPAAACSVCFLSSCCCMQLMLHAYLSAVACSLPIFLLHACS